MATWIVGGIVLLVVGFILWKMGRDRRNGKSACGGNCSHCTGACCYQVKPQK